MMASIEVFHYNPPFIIFFIEDEESVGIEHLCDVNFCDIHTLKESIKLGFNPTKWEKRFPYSKILVKGIHYTQIT